MFGVLLESRARRQRRPGVTALSAVAHAAVITAATMATAHAGVTTPPAPQATIIHFVPARPVAATPLQHTPEHTRQAPSIATNPPAFVPHIAVPTITPVGLPTLPSPAAMTDNVIIRSGSSNAVSRSLIGGDGASGDAAAGAPWSGADLMLRVVHAAKPRYPDVLRQAGIGGRVLVRFTVDTVGAVDMHTVQVIESTNDQFTNAVRVALAQLRLRPAESQGRRVRALAEMAFEFSINP